MGLFDRNKDQQSAAASTSSMAPANVVKLVKDPSGSSAVNLSKVRDAGHVDLAKKADKAGVSLSKRDLAGIRAQAVLILDHSGSMGYDYQSGVVQQLVERSLGFALQIDLDGSIPVIPFDSRVHPTVDVTVNNYQNVVNREIYKPNKMGTTDLAAALKELVKLAASTDAPIFAIVITDGNPDDKSQTTRVVCDLARYPVFLKFLAIQQVDYLQDLDDLPDSQRLLDNVDAKFISNPAGMSDLDFADAMVDEWDSWINLATARGVIV